MKNLKRFKRPDVERSSYFQKQKIVDQLPKRSLENRFINFALQEFLSSLLLFMTLIPMGFFFGDTWYGWLIHFFGVIIFDVITFGAVVNPCVNIGLYVRGIFSFSEATVRIFFELLVASFILPTTKVILPLSLPGPCIPDGGNIYYTALAELFAACLLMIGIELMPSFGEWFKRPFIALVLRVLIYLSRSFGGCFNPMVALAFKSCDNLRWPEYGYVYVLSPIVGASIGSKICRIVLATSQDDDKND